MPPGIEEFLTPAHAAALLGVGVDTIRRWDKEGKLSSVRTLGNHRRFRRADIDAFIAKQDKASA